MEADCPERRLAAASTEGGARVSVGIWGRLCFRFRLWELWECRDFRIGRALNIGIDVGTGAGAGTGIRIGISRDGIRVRFQQLNAR